MEPNKEQKKLRRNTVYSKHSGQHSKSLGKTLLKILGLLILLVAAGATAWSAKAYIDIKTAADSTFDGKTSKKVANGQPVSILLLGVDTGVEGRIDRGNSDTMILATINPKTKKSSLTSIPRDLLAEIRDNSGQLRKINSAYNSGGSKVAKATVGELLNIPVDYYITVDMGALEQLVNAVGGIDVDVPFDFEYGWTKFKKGPTHLNGHGALDYARMRHDDPEQDYGRQKRQRQVIQGIIEKGLTLKGISNYQQILKVISKYMKTNLSFDDMTNLAMNYRGAAGNLKSDFIQGHDAWIDGSAYQVAKTSELQRVSNQIRTSLGLKEEKLQNEITRQNSLQEGLKWKNPAAFENYVIKNSTKKF